MTDTAPLTDQQLAGIRQRTEASTPGPWHLDEDDVEIWSADHSMVADIWEPTHTSMNGEFIAHARQDVPALLAEVERLRAELADARTAWRRLKTGLIANADLLDVPFSNAPSQSPWKRLKPAMHVLDDSLKPESAAPSA